MTTVVLDDDPTGTQAMADVSVVLDWSGRAIADAPQAGDRAVHVLTNARAYDAAEAGLVVASAARAARAALPQARIVLRGDSTLRGHVFEEYEALASVVAPRNDAVPLLLVLAFPAAGRVTLGGVHLLERDGVRVPLHDTEYATDGALAYHDAHLARWAQERSRRRLVAASAVEVPLARLRAAAGAEAVADAIRRAAAGLVAAVVVPDAETDADLAVIACGLRLAEADTPVIVRCSPAFAAVLTGSGSDRLVAPPSAEGGILLVCGSFVAATTAQLDLLATRRAGVAVTADVRALAAADASGEVARLGATARRLIAEHGLAVVATPRTRDLTLADAESQRRIAGALARVAAAVPAGVVVAKGGITSAVIAREGFAAPVARVVGPIAPGVSLWRLPGARDLVVVPGNVGSASLLADVVDAIEHGTDDPQAP